MLVVLKSVQRRIAPKTERSGFGQVNSRVVEFESPDGKISLLQLLISKTAHLDRHRFRQFAREIIDVHARPAVDVGRIFVREEESLHDAFLIARALEAHADSVSPRALNTASKVR